MGVWIAIVCAGFTMWIWHPPDGVSRLGPVKQISLPTWARPVPGAMASKRRGWIAALVAVLIIAYGWSISPLALLVGPVAGVGAWVGLGRLEPAAARRRRLQTLEDLPQALELMQACVQTGQPVRAAIETVSTVMGPPIRDLFDAVTNAISVGMSDEQAWRVLADDPVIGRVARDMARSSSWGTTVSDILAQHCVDLRRQGTAERLAAAKSVGVKSVLPLGTCYLPAFMLIGVVPVIAAGFTGLFG
ncbi:MAG: type II secretion system F family protein [Propionibacteriaceae bacterium]|nr:type II secretion system F family protein [Propionibacteriaceae bacterium]